jgi:hypothetical protein
MAAPRKRVVKRPTTKQATKMTYIAKKASKAKPLAKIGATGKEVTTEEPAAIPKKKPAHKVTKIKKKLGQNKRREAKILSIKRKSAARKQRKS